MAISLPEIADGQLAPPVEELYSTGAHCIGQPNRWLWRLTG